MADEKRKVDFGSGQCICPRCGYRAAHNDRGIPCTEKACPKCGSVMTGEPCQRKDRSASGRMMKFKCRDCGLIMVLSERSMSCVTCGGSNIVREGWKR